MALSMPQRLDVYEALGSMWMPGAIFWRDFSRNQLCWCKDGKNGSASISILDDAFQPIIDSIERVQNAPFAS